MAKLDLAQGNLVIAIDKGDDTKVLSENMVKQQQVVDQLADERSTLTLKIIWSVLDSKPLNAVVDVYPGPAYRIKAE
jgi:hypothetical protein